MWPLRMALARRVMACGAHNAHNAHNGRDRRRATMRAIYGAWLEWVRTLYTGYFACVMATGIVSVALLLSNVVALSLALWVVGFVLLAGMALVYAIRIMRYPREL